MLTKLIAPLVISISLMFLMMNHPLSMGLMMICQTILISLLIGSISQSFWFSYVTFLIMVGGMLILFIYVISLIFNKIFLQKLNLKLIFMILTVMLILTYFIYMNFNLYINNSELLSSVVYSNMEYSLNLIKLYNFPINLINLAMINYLFFLLIVVVKITNFFYGPLRMKI